LEACTADLDKLEVFTRVSGYLVNETPLRVGVGREPPLGSPVDTAVLRIKFADGRSYPYIPGSSLKGVLRSLAESILRAQGLDIPDPWPKKRGEGQEEELGIEETVEGEKKLDAISCIFGSLNIASHVRIYDAYPVGEPVLFVKTGVGINRDFLGAQPGALFTEEQVAPGTRWSFRMDILNIEVFPQPKNDLGKLLRNLVDLLANGFVQVGARRTIGYGVVRLVEGKYEVYRLEGGVLKKTQEGGIP